MKIIVERLGTEVRIILQMPDAYQAIKLYDEIDEQSDKGHISLKFGVTRNDDTSSR